MLWKVRDYCIPSVQAVAEVRCHECATSAFSCSLTANPRAHTDACFGRSRPTTFASRRSPPWSGFAVGLISNFVRHSSERSCVPSSQLGWIHQVVPTIQNEGYGNLGGRIAFIWAGFSVFACVTSACTLPIAGLTVEYSLAFCFFFVPELIARRARHPAREPRPDAPVPLVHCLRYPQPSTRTRKG